MDCSRRSLEVRLHSHGLRLRGGWVPTKADALPALPAGGAPAVVWMVGQVGSGAWPAFSASPFAQDGRPDPMDRWSKSIGNALARQLDGYALYPSDGPPWQPFQRWAARSEPLQASPLMLQIHPRHGLWHALRFALVLPVLAPDDAGEVAAPHGLPADICAHCDGQPCLHACPVDAFSGSAFRVDDCADHLHDQHGADCMQRGCLARRACPVGADYRYVPAHAAFHMAAFADAHRGRRLADGDLA